MRSWDKSQKSVPYYRQTQDIEAAKFLRLVADRYVKGRANCAEVLSAFQEFDRVVNYPEPGAGGK